MKKVLPLCPRKASDPVELIFNAEPVCWRISGQLPIFQRVQTPLQLGRESISQRLEIIVAVQ